MEKLINPKQSVAATKVSGFGIWIHRALPGQAELLTEIALAAKASWGYPEPWIEAWKTSLLILPTLLMEPPVFVATQGEMPVGFYVLRMEVSHCWLDHLWILPAWMGQGIGRALFNHAMECARAADINWLGVESDPNAEGFYLRMGAERIGTKFSRVCGVARELPLLVFHLATRAVSPGQADPNTRREEGLRNF